MGKIEDLEKIQELKTKGILTEEEFEMEKSKILNDGKIEKQKDSDELTAEEFLTIKNKLSEDTTNTQSQEKSNTSSNEKVEIEENANRVCKKCNNPIIEGEKFCGKCGKRLKNKKGLNKKSIVFTIIFVVLLGLGGAYGLYLYGKDIVIGEIKINNIMSDIGITDEYMTKKLKEKGFEQFDDAKVKILAIEDIEYNNFNKLAIAKHTITNNGVTTSLTGISLINRKEDIVESFDTNMNIIYLLNGLSNEESSKAQEIASICAKYVQEKGIEFFDYRDSLAFKRFVKELSDTLGIEKSRRYVNNGFGKTVQQQGINLDYTLLFDKESALVKYIAYYETRLQYNTNYPFNERQYKYFSNDYSYRDTLNSLEYVYGPAYELVKEYVVYDMSGYEKVTNEEEFEKTKVGAYKSLNDAKTDLNVD